MQSDSLSFLYFLFNKYLYLILSCIDIYLIFFRLKLCPQIPIAVRFLFVLLGPSHSTLDYHEVGRAIGALMSNAVSIHICCLF